MGQIALLREFGQRLSGMRPERHRGGTESVKSKIGYLASYARIAIHIGKFSPLFPKMARRTRNKIAQTPPAGLRLLPVISAASVSPRTLTPRVEES
jgi:hypothetical protein